MDIPEVRSAPECFKLCEKTEFLPELPRADSIAEYLNTESTLSNR